MPTIMDMLAIFFSKNVTASDLYGGLVKSHTAQFNPLLTEHRGAEIVGDSKIRVAPPQAETSV